MKIFNERSTTDMYATQADGKTLEIKSLKYSDEDDPVKGRLLFVDDSELDLKLISTIQIVDYSGESDPDTITLYHCYIYGIYRMTSGEREYLFTAKIIG